MKKNFKGIMTVLILVIMMLAVAMPAFAAGAETEAAVDTTAVSTEAVTEDKTLGDKAWSAAIVVGIAAMAGAIAMGWAIAKSVDGISRQPEAEGKIRTTLMLGLVFVETAIIYALVIAILIIFVL